jgi:hypothetical protein
MGQRVETRVTRFSDRPSVLLMSHYAYQKAGWLVPAIWALRQAKWSKADKRRMQ